MKLSFSTYGWHDLEWDDFVSLARDMRMQGIEIHDLDDARLSGPNGPFAEEEAVRTARALAADGISRRRRSGERKPGRDSVLHSPGTLAAHAVRAAARAGNGRGRGQRG